MIKAHLKSHCPNIVRALQLIRYEYRSACAHICGKLSLRQALLIRRLGRSGSLKLNVASGVTRFDGWVSIDVGSNADLRMDLRRRLPLPNCSAKLIFCEHFCDYVNFPDEILRLLREFVRVLEVGGRVRVVLQDGKALMKAYLDQDRYFFGESDSSERSLMEVVNELIRSHGFRHFLYDYETFERSLLLSGFSEVVRLGYRQSECPEIVLDHEQPIRRPMSLYIEAIKR